MARDLEYEIQRIEGINEELDDYGESHENYEKEDVIKIIQKHDKKLFTEEYYGTEAIERFLKAIRYYDDDEVLTELFKVDPKKALIAISKYTKLLENEETERIVYDSAIRGTNRNIERLEEELAKQRVFKCEFEKRRDELLLSEIPERKLKEDKLRKLQRTDEEYDEILEKAKKWDELQAKQNPDKNTELYTDELNIDLYEE